MISFEMAVDAIDLTVKVQEDIERVRPSLSAQILKDCNEFCKHDQGELESSSLTKSDLKHGELIWDTVYAQMQYYLESASHDVNPKACRMWCEKAFSVYGQDWEAMLQKLLEE